MRIAIIGAGYVGLVSGACFADFGHQVVCVDSDARKIAALRVGVMPIYEPGLEELVERNLRDGRLAFSTDLSSSIADVQAVFIAVGTPARHGDGHADMRHVYQVAGDIARAATGPLVLVTKSTVPVGTGDEIDRICAEIRADLHIEVVSNPEFLRQGAAIADFKKPDRIVVGCRSDHARQTMNLVYHPLYLNQAPILHVDRRASELIKYASNAYLAVKITFINEIADLCEKAGADVQEVARAMGFDNRIGGSFLQAGPGYGGSCFPKDTTALIKTGQDFEARLRIVEAAVDVNEQRKRAMGRKIIKACGGNVRGKTVAVLGLAFKPNTDDMREAPALAIVAKLLDEGAVVRAYDPESMEQAGRLLPDVEFCPGVLECVKGANAVVIVTEWDEFRALDFQHLRREMRDAVLIDLRNIYSAEVASQQGFAYECVGRPSCGASDVVDVGAAVSWTESAV